MCCPTTHSSKCLNNHDLWNSLFLIMGKRQQIGSLHNFLLQIQVRQLEIFLMKCESSTNGEKIYFSFKSHAFRNNTLWNLSIWYRQWHMIPCKTIWNNMRKFSINLFKYQPGLLKTRLFTSRSLISKYISWHEMHVYERRRYLMSLSRFLSPF